MMIFYDGEHIFPEHANEFKNFLKKYLMEHQAEYLLEQKTFVYDSDCDEFLESDIQEFYKIWLMA